MRDERWGRIAVAVSAAVIAILADPAGTAAAQGRYDPAPIFNGRDLNGWIVERVDASVRDGVLALGNGSGWVRTKEPYADFVLTFEARTLGPDDAAALWIRAWPTVNETKQPDNGFHIGLIRDPLSRWHRYRVRCVRQTIEGSIDGQETGGFPSVSNPQGFFLLQAERGQAEFRDIVLQRIAPDLPPLPVGVVDAKAPGVVLPRPRQQSRPNYTSTAMRQLIQGPVLVTAIVAADGSLTDVAIGQSLDPRFGLDDEALKAAKQWKFEPATVDGSPVPFRITIELSFTLR
jgi:TonB family protein